jgi:dihydrodipicolinate synthase/N-acetylneuraminate lyase
MDVFTGVGVALVTLLDESGGVDTASTAALAADLVDRGMRGVLVCGTTGEAATLTDGERTELIEAVRGALPGDIPVIAGAGAPTAGRAAVLTAAAAGAGADAVVAWPPPGSEDLGGYFSAVAAAAGGLPVLGYHIPWVSAPGIPVSALPGLPISGLKDSSGDPDRLLAEVVHYPVRPTWARQPCSRSPGRSARPARCWRWRTWSPSSAGWPSPGTRRPSASSPTRTWPSARAGCRSSSGCWPGSAAPPR